ncbi:MAG: WecB/TagA/CpsF family glycosyltransferase [Collinsella sp.]|jgi:N-acetylglucosaminyldiphosphoundecaprenol N-acetyl-beta-D-mannosaminyltransferase|uniref:WecB/TagA/CpsF family glycosyltransferase n=2 Tax=Collinsella TaxID=102106 RepID=UPI000E4E810C|nr:WecB/TagA/CpsF family glycosyltransferase [Collinsella sp. AF08-23]RHS40586.1 glycosyltransferase [Collinsella sp. AF08-23]
MHGPSDPRLARTPIIDVPITATNMGDALAFISEHLTEIKGEYICVSNAHTTVMAHDDPAYYRVQTESLMSVPDGKPLSVVGRKAVPTMSRVTGPDLMREVFEVSAERGYRHYLYGNTRENLDALVEALERDYPGIDICGAEPSVFRDMTPLEEAELAGRINRTEPDFVWVALGAPRQECFCHRMRGSIDGLMVGVGGAFNILAGITPEAPVWMQNLSLEWLYRLIQEPKRLFGRYFVTNSKFMFYQVTGSKRKKENK